MASESWTLKVEFQGERRRLKDWVPVGEEPTVTLVRSGVAVLFDMSPELELKLQYKDNEGEVCTLTDMTLPDALCLAVESRTLRIVCELVAAEAADTNSAVDHVRAHLQDGGVRLRTSLEQFGTNVSNGLQNGRINAQAQAQHLSTSASHSLQAGAQQLGENIQESRASLRASAGQFVEEFRSNFQTTSASVRSTIGQISSEIQTNLQEGREGFKKRSQELGGDLREGGVHLKQSLTESMDGLMTGEGSAESSKARMASAAVAGGVALAVTRSLPLAVVLGAFAAGAASAAPVQGTAAQESAGSETGVPDIARPTSELSASDAEELIDSDIISLPNSSVGENDVQDTQTAIPDVMQTEHDEEDGMVLVDAESGSTSGRNSEAAAE